MNWHDFFEYEDGKLIWIYREIGRDTKRWNGRYSGKEAGKVNSKGYIDVKLQGKMYKAHRIIWEMHNGEIPKGMQIDHINRVRCDNRIKNLRLATNQSNQRNCNIRIDNTSGHVGVGFHKLTGKWFAHIGVDGKTLFSKLMDSIDDAILERELMSRMYKFDENHGKTLDEI